MALDLFILQVGGGLTGSVPSLIANSSLFAKGVLLVLVLMSVYSWAVIWNRQGLFGRVAKADKVFLGAFRRLAPTADCRLVCEQHPQSLLARVALSGHCALFRLFSPHNELLGKAGMFPVRGILCPNRRWKIASRLERSMKASTLWGGPLSGVCPGSGSSRRRPSTSWRRSMW